MAHSIVINCSLLICFLSTLIVNVNSRAFDPERSCHQRGCQESSLNECSRRGHSWASFTSHGTQTCLCCSDEKDALEAAGVNQDNEIGFFFGNVLRVCESLHIEEGHCRSRESRDCNFIPAFRGNNYLGCFYCRPRCDHESDCQDLGRTCDLSKNSQPVRSCTGTGSGYIPGFDDPREYETAIKKNYLLNLKNRTKPIEATSTTTTSTTTMLPIPLNPSSLSQSTKNHPQKPCNGYPGKLGGLCSQTVENQQQSNDGFQIPQSSSLSSDSSSFKKPFSNKKWPQQQEPVKSVPTNNNVNKINNVDKFSQTPSKVKPAQKPFPPFHPGKGTPSWSSITQQQQQQNPVLSDQPQDSVGESVHVSDEESWGSPHSMPSHSDDGFELGRSPHPHRNPVIHPVSGSHSARTTTSEPIQLERGFKPADSNETVFVVKNNHRQVHHG